MIGRVQSPRRIRIDGGCVALPIPSIRWQTPDQNPFRRSPMRLCRSVLIATLLSASPAPIIAPLVAPPALAQELKQAKPRDIKRLNGDLDRIAKRIAKIRPAAKIKIYQGIAKQLGRTRTKIDKYAAGGEMEAIEARFAEVTEQYETALAAFDARSDQRDSGKEVLEARAASGELAEEERVAMAALQLANRMASLQPTQPGLGKNPQILEIYRTEIGTFTEFERRLAESTARYEGFDPRDIRDAGAPTLSNLIRTGGQPLQLGRTALQRFGAPALTQGTMRLDQATAQARGMLAAGQAAALVQSPMIAEAKGYAGALAAIYEARVDADPAVQAQFTALSQRAENQLGGLIDQACDEVVAANRLPANAYIGADRGDIEAFLRSRFTQAAPEREILQVRLEQPNFNRRQDWIWHGNTLTERDYGLLSAWIVVAEAPDRARYYDMVVTKDYLQSGALSASFGSGPRKDEGRDCLRTVLRSAVTDDRPDLAAIAATAPAVETPAPQALEEKALPDDGNVRTRTDAVLPAAPAGLAVAAPGAGRDFERGAGLAYDGADQRLALAGGGEHRAFSWLASNCRGFTGVEPDLIFNVEAGAGPLVISAAPADPKDDATLAAVLPDGRYACSGGDGVPVLALPAAEAGTYRLWIGLMERSDRAQWESAPVTVLLAPASRLPKNE